MRPSAAIAAAILGLMLAGCGGGSTPASAGRSRAVLKVLWPERSRLIPRAANSLVVVLSKGSQKLKEQTIVRPTGSTTTETTFDGLPVGKLSVSVSAFPTPDGQGNAQATGSSELTTSLSNTGRVTVSLTSTATSLTLSPATLSMVPGETKTIAASAKDVSGNVVLLAAEGGEERLVWTTGSPGIATVVGSGTTASITGHSGGSTTIRASLPISDAGGTIEHSVSVAVFAGTPGTGASWPMADGNPQRTARGSGSRIAGNVAWTFTPAVNGLGGGPPAVGPDGTVYFMADNKALAYNGATGTKKWEHPLQTMSGYGPALGKNGLVYFPGQTELVALETASGNLRWSIGAGSDNGSPLVAADGSVFFGAGADFYHVDGATGDILWKKRLSTLSNAASPALGTNGLVYVAQPYDKVYALSTLTGNVKWTFTASFQQYWRSLSVGADGILFVGGTGGVNAIDGTTGAFLWNNDAVKTTTENGIAGLDSLPIDTDGTVYAADKTKAVALDPLTGTTKWSVTLPATGQTAVPVALSGEGALYVLEIGGSGQWQGVLHVVETAGAHAVTSYATGIHTGLNKMSVGGDGTVYIPGQVLQAIR